MNNSLTIGKKALVTFVAIATIAWTLGIAAFAAPTASAATPGTLVKSASLSAVYYYGTDGQRYTFPNLKTYETWYTDFSSVTTISDSELAAIPLAGNVVYRSGSRWVKIQSDSKTYAVTPDGTLRWVDTEAVAVGLAGSAWNTIIDDVPEVFFVDYSVGSSLMTAAAYEGMYLTDGTNDYVVLDGEKQMLTDAGKTANRVQDRFVLTPGDDLLGSLSAGADVTAADGDLNDPAQLGDSVATVAGGLSVSLASDTPASATVPDGASQVSFMKFNLTANSGAATVSSLVIKMAGLGATGNISSVYLYENGVRLTNGRSVNSTTRLATFASLGLAVADGQTRTLEVVADMAAAQNNGGDTMQFQIESVDSVTTDASVSGSFPVTSNSMTKSATDVGTVTITDTGTISNPSIGAVAKIANFTLTANSTEGFQLSRLRAEVDRAADHSAYELRQNNVKLADGVVSGTYVDFTLATPFEVAQGNNRAFDIYTKVAGERSELINVRIEETTDVYAVGLKYGYGTTVTNTSFGAAMTSTCTGDGTSYDCSTIQAGKLTVVFNGPNTGDISENKTAVTIWNGAMTAANLVEVRNLAFAITGNDMCTGACGTVSTTHNYQNFRLVDAATGSTISGPYDMSSVTDGTGATITMTDDFTIPSGETWDVQLLMDVQDDATFTDITAGDTIAASWTAASTTARDANNDTLTVGTDIIPGSNLLGNTFTIRTASLTVAVASSPGSATHVKGTSDVDMVGFAFTAGTASDVTVSAVTFKMYGDDDASFSSTDLKDVNVVNAISSCSIYDSSTGALIDGPESPGTFTTAVGSDITFSGFEWLVPAGASYRMSVRCNLANLNPDTTDAVAVTNDIVTLEIDATGDVSATDGDGNSVAGTTANTTQTIAQTIANAGTLAIALDGDNTSSTIVLSNSTGVTTSKYKFTATNEAYVVDRLTVDNTGGSDVTVDSIELHYENQAGESKIATGFLTSGTYIFNGLDLYVPKDDTSTLTVKLNTGDVTTGNAGSGSVVGLDLSNDDSNDDEFRAVGIGSGTTINDSTTTVDASFTGSGDGVIASNDHEIRKTKPTLSLASGSPSGAAIVGLIEVLRFNITADSRGDVQVDDLTFEMSSTDNAGTGWNACDTTDIVAADVTLYDADDLSSDISSVTSLLEADGTACNAAAPLKYINIDFASAETVAAGTTKTYVLKINVANTTSPSAVQDDSMRVDLPSEDVMDAATSTDFDVIGWVDSNTTVVDTDADSGSIDAEYIKNLPINGGSLIF